MKSTVLRIVRGAVTAPLRLAPAGLQNAVLEQVLNRVFREPVADGELDFLEDRTVLLEIPELEWRWPITLRRGSIRVQRPDSRPDTVVRGTVPAFAAIAAGLVDPDTLFFQRRLSVEGDTELGLALKNFLDALEPPGPPLQFALRGAAALYRKAASRADPPPRNVSRNACRDTHSGDLRGQSR